MPRIAIMQGRLQPPQDGMFQCFPRNCWREEFPQAAAAGLDAIEWIYDWQGDDVNPLVTDSGIAEMQVLAGKHHIDVVSVCADYFMDRPFVTAGSAFAG
jgi:hexulose-6-phosphate isomerase